MISRRRSATDRRRPVRGRRRLLLLGRGRHPRPPGGRRQRRPDRLGAGRRVGADGRSAASLLSAVDAHADLGRLVDAGHGAARLDRGACPAAFRRATGAFIATGALIMLAGLWSPLGRLVGAIPKPIANGMLAGILLKLCLVALRGARQGRPAGARSSSSSGWSSAASAGSGRRRRRSSSRIGGHGLVTGGGLDGRCAAAARMGDAGLRLAGDGVDRAAALHRHHGLAEHSRA